MFCTINACWHYEWRLWLCIVSHKNILVCGVSGSHARRCGCSFLWESEPVRRTGSEWAAGAHTAGVCAAVRVFCFLSLSHFEGYASLELLYCWWRVKRTLHSHKKLFNTWNLTLAVMKRCDISLLGCLNCWTRNRSCFVPFWFMDSVFLLIRLRWSLAGDHGWWRDCGSGPISCCQDLFSWNSWLRGRPGHFPPGHSQSQTAGEDHLLYAQAVVARILQITSQTIPLWYLWHTTNNICIIFILSINLILKWCQSTSHHARI